MPFTLSTKVIGDSDIYNSITIAESGISSCINTADGIKITIPDGIALVWDTDLEFKHLFRDGDAKDKVGSLLLDPDNPKTITIGVLENFTMICAWLMQKTLSFMRITI